MARSTMKPLLVATALIFATAAQAGSEPFDSEILGVTQRLATSMDSDGDGVITAKEHKAFTTRARYSIDANSDGLIEKREFLAWDVGYQWIADTRGAGAEYAQIKNDLFDLWDLNDDGSIDSDELFARSKAEFLQSDSDGDRRISKADVARGSLTITALMSAV